MRSIYKTMTFDAVVKPAPKEIIYVDRDMKPCAKEKSGARKAKYIPEYELYVIERSY